VGTGTDLTIAELADKIARVVGFSGAIRFDTSKPDGTPRKVLDISRLRALGWQPRIDLDTGIRTTYQWYRAEEHATR
jgi:GDP-L-fucose synthase